MTVIDNMMMYNRAIHLTFFLIVILCCCHSSQIPPDNGLSLVVEPEAIEDGTTKDLTANCTYEYSNSNTGGRNQTSSSSFNVYTLTSIVLSRTPISHGDDNETDMGLAYLSVVSPKNVTTQVLPSSDVTDATGQVSVNGMASLFVTWDKPSGNQIGTYTCEATFLDSNGHSHVIQRNFHVGEGDAHLSHKYTLTMNELRIQLEAAKDCCLSLTQNVEDASQWKSKASVGLERMVKLTEDTLKVKMSNEYKGGMYVLTTDYQKNFIDAKELCERLGGYLLEVNDEDEWNFIKTFLATKGPVVAAYYIGGKDDLKEGEWYWITSNTTINYTAWNVGEPNNFGSENCLEIIQVIPNTVVYNDLNCILPLHAVCEFDNLISYRN